MGRITKWNDKADRGAQPRREAARPATSSWCTAPTGRARRYIFTDFLSKVSREWKDKVGNATSVNWPVGLGGKGNEGVTQQVKQIEGAIGYVELIYALSNDLPYATVKNAAGEFVEPSLDSVTAAAASAKLRQGHRFPGVDHERARRRGVSDLVLHLAPGAAGHDGCGQGQGRSATS